MYSYNSHNILPVSPCLKAFNLVYVVPMYFIAYVLVVAG